jgi:hypothetical protein
MKEPQNAKDPGAAGFLRDAEAIEQDLVFPADPFARRGVGQPQLSELAIAAVTQGSDESQCRGIKTMIHR